MQQSSVSYTPSSGGGIFLSPLLLLMGWAKTRQSAGVSAAFILANSIAGLAGNVAVVRELPHMIVWLIPAAIVGWLVQVWEADG